MLAKKLESAAKAVESAYIEDVFSTYVYTGVGANTWNNGIDLSTKGGMVWVKCRSSAYDNVIFDTARGASNQLITNSSAAETSTNGVTAFTTTGFSTGSFNNETSLGGEKYVSWTLRKQPKFFDIVTYTGTGSARTISHSLGATPGCMIVKRTSGATGWEVYHSGLINASYSVQLELPDAQSVNTGSWNSTAPTSTVFSVGNGAKTNAAGQSYVAYLFAHDAGGFGASGNDNVITCGSYTGNGSTTGPVVTLGYEPQWLLIKSTSNATDWYMVDTMRGFWTGDTSTTLHDLRLRPNTADAEGGAGFVIPLSTGFQLYGANAAAGAYNGSGSTYIYIAIRKGPMKVPTTGTSVFSPNSTSGTTGTPITTGFPIDWQLLGINAGNALNQRSSTRLTGVNTDGSSNSQYLATSSTNAEAATGSVTLNWGNTGFQVPSLNSGSPIITWNFQRAPGFFDEVCYTGTGSTLTLTHNLGVAPELLIAKKRNAVNDWYVLFPAGGSSSRAGYLDADNGFTGASATVWGDGSAYVAPTSTQVTVGSYYSGSNTAVMYLFATCPGVSKVGSYTGNGSSQTINCGFAAGARFVLIKRTDTVGDWYVWDTARGIVSGNDPHLSLNTTAAEVTTDDTIDPDSTGFIVTQLSATNVNVSSATYIYLAIA